MADLSPEGLSSPAAAALERGVMIGSDVTHEGHRYIYVRDQGYFDAAEGQMVPYGADGVRRVISETYEVSVVKVRPLCVQAEYAVTAVAATPDLAEGLF